MKLISRKEASLHLMEHGYPVSAATLAKLACRNARGGPPFIRFLGRVIRYDPQQLLAWAEARTERIAR